MTAPRSRNEAFFEDDRSASSHQPWAAYMDPKEPIPALVAALFAWTRPLSCLTHGYTASIMWQPIAPAAGQSNGRSQQPPALKKARNVSVACTECRKSKAKCDGARPRCLRCRQNQQSCTWDAPAGLTRSQRLRYQKEARSRKLEDLEQLFDSLTTSSEEEAINTLRKLRTEANTPSTQKTSPDSSESPRPMLPEPLSNIQQGEISPSAPAGHAPPAFISLHGSEENQDFLSLLFKRDDFLVDETEALMDATSFAETIDPSLLHLVGHNPSTLASSQNHVMAPTTRNAYEPRRPVPTPLQNRQSTVAMINLHPNLQNLFGNLPLSNALKANNYPPHVQQNQINNLSVPMWAMRAEFNNQVPCPSYDFTCFTSMYIFWYLMRWMIYPSPETYSEMPEWLRPTPNQLFMPHNSISDFIVWPAFRELTVQLPSMQERLGWMMEICINIRCDWPGTTEQALTRNLYTGDVDLDDSAKACLPLPLSLYLRFAPTIRDHVPQADSYMTVRTSDS
ncbi:hypothetical protein BS50DRAFT_627212 [Corynespora cassiicola Philippines]|uniref:Zn(2)-C6 fungal-type domain-containing protein n=1 Tax=Corynespora cassiicola Philippines TaxID=1448308 RepID=A0A2T2P824_CORCC|nr:hypothetical protein BS50DRAFT_627212 [Corynespora cassiicola Philippines]